MKTLNRLFFGGVYAICIWFFASWLDVIIYQGCGGTEHVWNLFIILSNIA